MKPPKVVKCPSCNLNYTQPGKKCGVCTSRLMDRLVRR